MILTASVSAYLTSVVHTAFARPQVTAKYHRFGSKVSIPPDAIAPVSVPVATPALGCPPVLPVLPVLPVPLLLDEHAASKSAPAARTTPPNLKCFLAI
jgi:hypothetical protein